MSLIEIEKQQPHQRKFPKGFLAVAITLTIASLGLAVGALISINGSNSGSAELGLGLVQTPACDTNGVTIKSSQSFVNDDVSSKFAFNEIVLSEISSNCEGKDFIIGVRGINNVKVPLSVDDAGNLIYSVRIWFNNYSGEPNSVSNDGFWSRMFTLVDGDSTTVTVRSVSNLDPTTLSLPVDEITGDVNWNGDTPKLYWQLNPENNDVSVVFNPSPLGLPSAGPVGGFADARHVYKYTLESTNHVG